MHGLLRLISIDKVTVQLYNKNRFVASLSFDKKFAEIERSDPEKYLVLNNSRLMPEIFALGGMFKQEEMSFTLGADQKVPNDELSCL